MELGTNVFTSVHAYGSRSPDIDLMGDLELGADWSELFDLEMSYEWNQTFGEMDEAVY